jgi:hypothetical protein
MKQSQVGGRTVIDTAWDEYRGWAARARALQTASQRWNTAALASAGAAAALGAAAIQFSSYPRAMQALSLLSALAAGAVPFLGKEILTSGAEAKWIRARATAEAIKSECYRYAARAGAYAGPDADEVFEQHRDALGQAAAKAGLLSLRDPVDAKGDKRRPPDRFDAAWYDTYRIKDQIDYYDKKTIEHEAAANRLRWLSFTASGVAALFGVAGAAFQAAFAPWIGVLTTIATAIAAQGLMGRRQQLAASYSAMAESLRRIRDRIDKMNLPDLVTRTEDLMESEHAAWIENMTKTIPAPPVVKKVEAQGG